MKNIISVLILLFLSVCSTLKAQQYSDGPVDVTVMVYQLWRYDYGDAGFGNAEDSYKVWVRDNANLDGTGWLKPSSCFTSSSGSYPLFTIVNYILLQHSYTSNNPMYYDIWYETWEDDRGGRCSYDTGGGIFSDDDDDHCGPGTLTDFPIRSLGAPCVYNTAPWVYFCGTSNDNSTGVQMKVKYTMPKPQIAQSTSGCTVTLTSSISGAGSYTGISFSWEKQGAGTVATTQNYSTSVAGSYRVTYSNGTCSNTSDWIIVNPSALTAIATSNSPVCSNESLQLNASPSGAGYTYNWKGPGSWTSSAQNPTVFPAIAGQYILTVSNGACSDNDTISVSTNPSPDFSVTSTNTSCGNNNGQITVTVNNAASLTAPIEYSSDNGINYQTSNTFSNLAATTYNVVVKDGNGCMDTIVQNLTNSGAKPDPSFTFNTFCEGTNNGPTTITTTGGTFSFSPTPTDGATIDPSTGVISNAVGGTTYTVKYVVGASGCKDSSTVNITVNDAPTLSVSADATSICIGDTLKLHATGTGTVSWTGPDSFSSSAMDTVREITTTTQSGYYVATITGANSCVTKDSVLITSNSTPSLAVDTIINPSCGLANGAIQLTVSGGTPNYTFNWSDGTTTVGTSEDLINVSGNTYTVTVTDVNSCSVDSTFTLSNTTGPTLAIVSTSDATCFGDSTASIVLNTTGGTPGYTYLWDPAISNPSDSVGGLTAGTYTIVVSDSKGCTDTVTTTIGSGSEIIIDTTIVHATCYQDNGSITLNASGGAGDFTYDWNPVVSQNNTATNLYGDKTYTITVTDKNGCSKTVVVNLKTSGTFFLDAIPDNATIQQGESVPIYLNKASNITIEKVIWTPPTGLNCSGCENPVASPKTTTTYYVQAISESGCVASDTVIIYVNSSCGEIFVPTSFSPNADGTNDLQCVMGGCIMPKRFKFTIFDRWGEVVFHTTDPNKCWDGTFRGKMVQTGVYVYKLKATLENGEKIEKTGNINVVR